MTLSVAVIVTVVQTVHLPNVFQSEIKKQTPGYDGEEQKNNSETLNFQFPKKNLNILPNQVNISY